MWKTGSQLHCGTFRNKEQGLGSLHQQCSMVEFIALPCTLSQQALENARALVSTGMVLHPHWGKLILVPPRKSPHWQSWRQCPTSCPRCPFFHPTRFTVVLLLRVGGQSSLAKYPRNISRIFSLPNRQPLIQTVNKSPNFFSTLKLTLSDKGGLSHCGFTSNPSATVKCSHFGRVIDGQIAQLIDTNCKLRASHPDPFNWSWMILFLNYLGRDRKKMCQRQLTQRKLTPCLCFIFLWHRYGLPSYYFFFLEK